MSDRLTRRSFLVGALAVAATLLTPPDLPAQKKDKDDGKWTFELYQDRAKEHRWRLKAANNLTVATSSEGYKSHAGAKEAIETIRAGIAEKMKTEFYEDRAKGHRWRLKAANGKIMATSAEGYKTKAGAEEAFDRVKKAVGSAVIKDAKGK